MSSTSYDLIDEETSFTYYEAHLAILGFLLSASSRQPYKILARPRDVS